MAIERKVIDPEKQDDTSIKCAVAQSSTSSCKKTRFHLLLKGINVSITTISRRLSKEFGLKSYKPVKKPQLISQIKEIGVYQETYQLER